MPDAQYWRTIEDVDEALEALIDVSQTVMTAYKETHRLSRQQDSALDLVATWGVSNRRQLEQAIHMTQSSVKRMRSHAIRVLVDEEGMTISHVARLAGISRQAVSALYQIAISELTTAERREIQDP